MKKKKRLIAASCGVVLFSGIVTGCSATKDSATTSVAPLTSGTAAVTSTPAPAKPLELTWMRYEHPSQAIVPDSLVVQEILKRQNVKLNLQSAPSSNYDDKKKTLIATNTMPDILLVKQDDIQNFADSGVFLDLTPYIDKMPNFKKVMDAQPEILKNKIDGKLYGFPLVNKASNGDGGQIPMIRTDLLEKLNLKAPTSYDELYQVLKKFKEAYPTTYPFTARAANGISGTENLLNPITFGFGSGYTTFNGTKVYYDPATKKYEFGPNSPQFKEAVTWLHKLYMEKLLDPDYPTATSQIWQEKLSSGKSLFFEDNNGFAGNFNLALQKTDPKAQFDMLDTMKGPNGTKRNLIYTRGHLSESYVINAKVKNPDQVVKFMDWLYSEEGSTLTSFGLEKVDYTIGADGQPKMSDADLTKFKDKQPSMVYALQSALGTGYLGLSLYDDARIGIEAQTPSSLAWGKKATENVNKGENFQFVSDPPFTKDERDKLKQLRSQLDAYLTQNMDKFIIADGALKDWDSFVADLKAKGSGDLVKIYNDALARVK